MVRSRFDVRSCAAGSIHGMLADLHPARAMQVTVTVTSIEIVFMPVLPCLECCGLTLIDTLKFELSNKRIFLMRNVLKTNCDPLLRDYQNNKETSSHLISGV